MEVQERRKFEEALVNAKKQAESANVTLEEQALELELQHQQLQEQQAELEHASEQLHILNKDLKNQREAADEQTSRRAILSR